MRAMQTAMTLFYDDLGLYPTLLTLKGTTGTKKALNCLTQTYMAKLPVDTINTPAISTTPALEYVYTPKAAATGVTTITCGGTAASNEPTTADRPSYLITFKLENPNKDIGSGIYCQVGPIGMKCYLDPAIRDATTSGGPGVEDVQGP